MIRISDSYLALILPQFQFQGDPLWGGPDEQLYDESQAWSIGAHVDALRDLSDAREVLAVAEKLVQSVETLKLYGTFQRQAQRIAAEGEVLNLIAHYRVLRLRLRPKPVHPTA